MKWKFSSKLVSIDEEELNPTHDNVIRDNVEDEVFESNSSSNIHQFTKSMDALHGIFVGINVLKAKV